MNMDVIYGWAISLFLSACAFMFHGYTVNKVRNIIVANRSGGIYFGISLLFLAHLLESSLFAFGYICAAELLHIGELVSDVPLTLRDYLYYSLVTYTSLGLGDLLPAGELRLLTGVEALVGLLLIGWSAGLIITEREV